MDKQDTVKVPAIGYSVVCNIPGDRQVTLQCFVDGDAPDEVLSAGLDKLLRQTDRIRAHYELPELEDQLTKHVKTLAQFQEDLAHVEAKHKVDQASRDVEIGELDNAIKEEMENGAKEHSSRGRLGSYEPRGYAKQRIEAIRAQQVQLRGQKDKAEAERTQAVQNLGISVQRYEQEIERLTAEIAKRKEVSQ